MEQNISRASTISTPELDKLSNMRILFFVPEGDLVTSGVYASQVGGLAKYCEMLGAKTMICDKGMNQKLWFYQLPRHFRKLTRQDDRLMAFKPTHIYVRTYASCIAVKELAQKTGAKLVYSIRGADVAESLLDRNLRAYVIAAWAWFCVKRAVGTADHVNSVSKTMADWIKRKYGIKTSVLPCCIAQIPVDDLLQKEQSSHDKTIVYSGSLSAWQKIDSIIEMMKKISEADASIKFRFLTKDVDALEQMCGKIGLDNSRWSAKACKQSEVPVELAKADCGIILRDDTLVNQVASPIKVGEYLAAGLGLILSPFIGDVGKDLKDKDFACFTDENTPVEQIVEFVNGMDNNRKANARKWAMEHLTYDGNKQAVLEMFS